MRLWIAEKVPESNATRIVPVVEHLTISFNIGRRSNSGQSDEEQAKQMVSRKRLALTYPCRDVANVANGVWARGAVPSPTRTGGLE